MADKSCSWIDPVCNAGQAVSDFAQGQIADFVKSIATGIIQVLKVVNSFWIYAPSPDVKSNAITTITNDLAWYTYAFALIGIVIAVIRMVLQQEFRGGMPGVKMLFNLIIVTGAYATGIAAIIKAGDAFAPWIIEKATGSTMDITSALSVDSIMSAGIGPAFLLVLVGFLGALANLVFMLVRASMLSILVAFLPAVAASSGTETGNQAWKKANGYLISFLLFKPVAAVIFALGILQIKNPPTITGLGDVGNAILSTSTGIMTLIMAALALPALIKFIVPVAANGTSMAFSGGAAAALGVAAGAAVVTLGAGAAAGGAGAAAGGAGAAGGTFGGGGAAAGGSSAAAGGGGSGGSGSSASGSEGGSAGGAPSQGADGAGNGGGGSDSSAAGGSSSGGNRSDNVAEVLRGLSTATGSAGNGVDEATRED